jgi:hypothetical protein
MRTLIIALTLTASLSAAEFAEVSNPDNTVLRVKRGLPLGWVAPTNKFGAEFATRFVLVTVANRPVVEDAIFNVTATNTVTSTNLVRDWVVTRRATPAIERAIRDETERRVREVISLPDAVNYLARSVELHDKQLDGAVFKPQSTALTAGEKAQRDAIQAIWTRAKAIRAHGATLEAQAASITNLTGWPK